MNWRGYPAASRFLTRALGLSLCTLGLLLCDARSAWATCGDYLHGPGGHGLAMGDQFIPSHGADPLRAPPGPRCHGPQCQRDNHLPAAPSKAISIPVPSDAILASITSLIRPAGLVTLTLDKATEVTGPEDRVFRPPRAA